MNEMLIIFLEGVSVLLLFSGSLLVFLRIKTRGTLMMLLSAIGMGISLFLPGLYAFVYDMLYPSRWDGPPYQVEAAQRVAFLLGAICLVVFSIGLFHFSTLFREAVAGEKRFRSRGQ